MPARHHSIFTDRMLFLTSNQQCQSSKGINSEQTNTFSLTPPHHVFLRCDPRLIPFTIYVSLSAPHGHH